MANIYKGLDLDITLGNNLSSFIGVGKDIGEAQRGNISIGLGIDLGIDLAKFGHSIAEVAVKTFKPLPAIGAGVSLASLSNNLNKIQDKKDTDKITDQEILNVISDTTGLIASAAGTAAVIGTTAAAGVSLGLVAVGLGVISVGTGIIAYGMGGSTAISDGVSAMNKAFSELADTLGAAYDKALESVSGALDKAFDSIMSGRKLPSADYTDLVNKLHEINTKMSNNGDTLNASLYDPIALDLDGNGKIDTLSLENGVFFDHNGDKIAFKSSWVNSSDGILARDIDGDGKITSGAELFGNFTKLKNGELAKNGKEALSDLDSDENGVFDERNEAFGQILVWQDFNSNGKAESGELKSLSEHGIKSINLEFSTDNTALDKDNKQILVGSFAINDSDEALASDIDFSVNTIEREMAESAGLVKGTGFVRDFKPNLSKEIEGFYTKYKELESKAEQIAATDELVGLWAKTAKQYKEIDNPIQKVKINISSVASNTTSSGIDEAIKRAEAGEIALSDGVKISA